MTEELDHLIRNRPIRRAVFQAALESGEPFSVAQLAAKCRKMRPPAYRATVYRNLRLLLKHGYLRETIVRSGLRVYQPATDSRNMVWVCDDCSRIQGLSGEDVVDQLKCLANRHGFHPFDLTLEIHCRCLQMRRNGFCGAPLIRPSLLLRNIRGESPTATILHFERVSRLWILDLEAEKAVDGMRHSAPQAVFSAL